MTLLDLLKAPPKFDEYSSAMKPLTPRIYCMDGTSLSVQASEFAYSSPRNNYGPWFQVEVGFPSRRIEELMPYAEDWDADPTATVYGYVPISIVEAAIESCGGINLEWTILKNKQIYELTSESE